VLVAEFVAVEQAYRAATIELAQARVDADVQRERVNYLRRSLKRRAVEVAEGSWARNG
jgi:hypothetical protein